MITNFFRLKLGVQLGVKLSMLLLCTLVSIAGITGTAQAGIFDTVSNSVIVQSLSNSQVASTVNNWRIVQALRLAITGTTNTSLTVSAQAWDMTVGQHPYMTGAAVVALFLTILYKMNDEFKDTVRSACCLDTQVPDTMVRQIKRSPALFRDMARSGGLRYVGVSQH